MDRDKYLFEMVGLVLRGAPAYLRTLGEGSEVVHRGSNFGGIENDTELRADKMMGGFFLRGLSNLSATLIRRIVIEGGGTYEVNKEGEFTAYVDPLDASLQYHLRNGTHGMAYSSVVTIVQEGPSNSPKEVHFSDIAVSGIVDLRFTNPPDIWTARSGVGIFLRGDRIVLGKEPTKVDLPSGQIIIAEMYYSNTRSATAQALLGLNGYVRSQGSAALEMAYVSNGMIHAFICMSQKLHEFGAAYLLTREAGGFAATFDRNFNPTLLDDLPYVFNSKLPVILACNGDYALDLLEKYKRAFPEGIDL